MEKNPKETAIELIKQFENVPMLQEYGGMDLGLAKECAIIAVERNIKILKEIAIAVDDCLDESRGLILELIEDEQKVKQEINNLWQN